MIRSSTVRTTTYQFVRRWYFTNGQITKSNDPYAILGLQWGDGASSADIKAAFRRQAQLLHPDVNKTDTPQQAIEKFQKLQKAYESLMKSVSVGGVGNGELDLEEWRMALWRQSDRMAQDRTDVAGTKRKRPAQPASVKAYGRELGHPGGGGNHRVRGEYLGEGKRASSSVGTGRSKWVQPKEFKPWTPQESNLVRASDMVKKAPR
jgi:hypothetical protein